MNKILIAASLTVLLSTPSLAKSSNIWLDVQAKGEVSSNVPGVAVQAHKLTTDAQQLHQRFAQKGAEVTLDIPLPDGDFAAFTLVPKSVFAPELAARYPELMAYQGVSNHRDIGLGRFEISPKGLRGMFTYRGQRVFVGPQADTSDIYYSFFAKDAEQMPAITPRETDYLSIQKPVLQAKSLGPTTKRESGDTVRTYRLAVTTTGEYTGRFGGVNGVMAELNTMLNRINGIFLADIAVQFELIANNDLLVFTDATTDPFENDGSVEDLEQNQTTTDDVIGTDNYDLGHILYSPDNGGGGLAFIGASCDFRIKAQGTTGSANPRGEEFYVDLVAHEFGHQLGAFHTFNATNSVNCNEDQRSAFTSVEPGSGTTIMSYAGICGEQNVQNFADPYFHAISLNQIQDYVDNSQVLFGGSCGTVTDPGNAVPQIVLPATQHTIPSNTPFVLSASASDSDSDASLTFAWDQIDADVASAGATFTRDEINQDNGFNPLFRSFEPDTSPTRYFPSIANQRLGVSIVGEALPTTARVMNFELVTRDNAGGTDREQVRINVELAGDGFAVTAPAADTIWIGGRSKTVTWNVAGTDTGNINCTSVDVKLDIDQQNTFDVEVAAGVPNTGSADIIVPDAPTDIGRLMVKCSDNVFFALNPGDIEVLQSVAPTAPVITGQTSVLRIDEDTRLTLSLNDLTIDDPDTAFPDGFTLNILAGDDYSSDGPTLSPNANFNGRLRVNVSVSDDTTQSPSFALIVEVDPLPDAPIAIEDNVTVDQDSENNLIDVLANDLEPDNETMTLSAIDYSGGGQLNIVQNQLRYTPSEGFSGSESATYTVSDPNGLSNTAIVTLNVAASAAPPSSPPAAPIPPASNNNSGGGGGSASWLLALMGVALAMRRRITLSKG